MIFGQKKSTDSERQSMLKQRLQKNIRAAADILLQGDEVKD